MFCGECGSAVNATAMSRSAADMRQSDTSIIQRLPRAAPPAPAIVSHDVVFELPRQAAEKPADADAVERTIRNATRDTGAGGDPTDAARSFLLSFSTGDTAHITAGGLLGRRPVAEPKESAVLLVHIDDPGRSVSKTHLEFGIEAGELWICDRFSANGTVMHPPTGRARPCEPGRRYRIGRGTRVEIGDQYFDVS